MAPVHESELRKCLDFVFGLGVDLGCFFVTFWAPFGGPWGDLGNSLGYFWAPWGLLAATLAAMGCSGMPLGPHFERLLHRCVTLGSKVDPGR